MRSIVSALSVVTLGLAAALWSSPASACACCDGSTVRKAVGWSKTGKTLLVRSDDWSACEKQVSLELWRVGQSTPARCYDLHGDPNRRIKCTEVTAPEDASVEPKTSKVERRFAPAQPIAGRWVRAWRTPASLPADADEDTVMLHEMLDIYVVHVDLWTGAGWQEVWRGEMSENRYPGEMEDPPLSAPLRVELWPTPAGDRAALMLHNDYTDPGIGHFFDDVRWVDVPEGTRALPGLTAASPRWQGEAIPAFDHGPGERRSSIRQNSQGLSRHRKGEFDAAALHFIEALRFDPSSVMARYNLACALARSGLEERSLAVLEELATAAMAGTCARCVGRIQRAAVDEDFDALRGDPRFSAIVDRVGP